MPYPNEEIEPDIDPIAIFDEEPEEYDDSSDIEYYRNFGINLD
jgi:hypothetical protein